MPFNSGTYSVAINFTTEAGSPPIAIAKLDTQMADIGTALSTCLLRDNTGGPTSDLVWTQKLKANSFEPSSATVPINGMYLSAANTVAFSSNTTLRASVNASGLWTFTTPAASALFSLTDGVVTSIVSFAGATTSVGNSSNHSYAIQTNGITRLNLTSAGVVSAWEGTYNVGAAALMQAATVESGSFTGTLTGCTTSPTATIFWRRTGPVVTLLMDVNLTATSNTTALTITGMTAALAPAKLVRMACGVQDSGTTQVGHLQISAAATTLTFFPANLGSFTNSGVKGVMAITCTYSTI